jgi:hypothetical protein
MKRFYVCWLVLLPLLAVLPLPGWAAGQDGLGLGRPCPQADKYRLQRRVYLPGLKEVVGAPQGPEELQARFSELRNGDADRRQAAIAALALAGNLQLFDELLAAGDSHGMATYAAHYLRADGTLCLDPHLEKAILQHAADPRFSQVFLDFFPQNLYSSRALFEMLDPGPTAGPDLEEYGRRVQALCATRLAGLDEQMLRIGRAALPHDSPARKRVMPGVHQSLIRYFAGQQSPVYDYFRAVLAAEPRREEVVYFQKSFAQTRRTLYQALSGYDDHGSFTLLVEQLGELCHEPWGPFFVEDLQQLLHHLRRHPLFEIKQDQVLALVRRLLVTPSLPGQPGFMPPRERAGAPALYDEQARKELHGLLASMESAAAGDLLLDELAALRRRPMGEARSRLITNLLQGLASFTGATPLAVDRLVAGGGQGEDPGDILLMAEIAARHADSMGFAFVLDHFDRFWAVGPERDNQDAHGDRLFELLLRFADPAFLRQTRARVDALFLEGKLTEERYLAMSRALTALLDDDSPTHQALLAEKEQQKQEQQGRELAAAQARWQQEMDEAFVRHSSSAGIAADIQALVQLGPAAKEAGYWLMRVGPAILPQAHQVLADPAASVELKMPLMVILGEIGEVASVPFIIEAAAAQPVSTMLLQEALLALARIPQTGEAVAFARAWLERPTASSRARISALAYFAAHRDGRALAWSRHLIGPDVEPNLRAAALYLAARAGDGSVKGQITAMLADNKEGSLATFLWQALAEIATVDEFNAVARARKAPETPELRQIGHYVRFLHSEGRQKTELAQGLLIEKTPLYAESACRFLLEQQEFALLSHYLRESGPYTMSLEMMIYVSAVAQRVFSEARRLGYRLEEKKGEISFLQDSGD